MVGVGVSEGWYTSYGLHWEYVITVGKLKYFVPWGQRLCIKGGLAIGGPPRKHHWNHHIYKVQRQ